MLILPAKCGQGDRLMQCRASVRPIFPNKPDQNILLALDYS